MVRLSRLAVVTSFLIIFQPSVLRDVSICIIIFSSLPPYCAVWINLLPAGI